MATHFYNGRFVVNTRPLSLSPSFEPSSHLQTDFVVKSRPHPPSFKGDVLDCFFGLAFASFADWGKKDSKRLEKVQKGSER
jgi:hypothetical protein